MKNHWKRFLSVVISIALLSTLLVPMASATGSRDAGSGLEKLRLTPVDLSTSALLLGDDAPEASGITAEEYKLTDRVRVSIVLGQASTLGAGYSMDGIASNAAAKAYRSTLKAEQDAVTARIEAAIGGRLDVKWNLTLAANMISAEVKYGDIARIEAVPGVVRVFIENRYDPDKIDPDRDTPDLAPSSTMIGSGAAWAEGYTGAGSKVAIIDTGVDIEHQSFSGEGLDYALRQNADDKGMSYEQYLAGLDLLTARKIDAVADQLNAPVTGSEAYISEKIPYGYCYVDRDYDVTHVNDTAEQHGSHVAGIATANRFVLQDGEWKSALAAVSVQGVAPDAQLVVMKVFGNGGGAYDSDYMAAIEDAIVLGCDSANLSLGSGSPGFAFSDTYEDVMNDLVANGMVVSFSTGNSGMWYDVPYNQDMYPYLYADDVDFATSGSPGTFTNSLTVGSVDNAGQTGLPLFFNGDENSPVFYSETSGYGNAPITTLAGETLSYVLLDSPGVDDNDHVGMEGDDFYALGSDVLSGKVAICYRGSSSFFAKANAAVAQGAIGVIIINNVDGTISMNLTGYKYEAPAVSILKADGDAVLAASEENTTDDGYVYYTGTLDISDQILVYYAPISNNQVEISSFSSWGVPGSLTMKPELLAPGGGIYSVSGLYRSATSNTLTSGHDKYETMSGTSMAAPQVAGMAAVLGQYIRENNLERETGRTERQLINSLLMSTAVPVYDSDGYYWPVLQQGAGLASVSNAISAKSYILMGQDATLFPDSAKDGKVKAELGDDPDYTGSYQYSFTIYPMGSEPVEYDLHTDIFTQWLAGNGGYGMLQDTSTIDIGAWITYTVNGVEYNDLGNLYADVNMDGAVNEDDAQAIIDMLAGTYPEDADFDEDYADVDYDGEITAEDAQLILDFLASCATVTVSRPTTVTVDIQVDPYDQEFLLYYFTNGFYVEGFTYVDPVADDEGAYPDVTHSIPLLGYCGSWTDPSMFDRTSYVDELYGTGKLPYLANPETNYMAVKYPGVSRASVYTGNPFAIEDEFPAERLAMNEDTSVSLFNYLPIRNIGTYAAAITDEDGEVLWAGDIGGDRYAPFYHVNDQVWRQTGTVVYKVNKALEGLDLNEGDKVTIGFYAIPEYYAIQNAKQNGKVAESGILDEEGFRNVLESGALGSGASISYTVTVDNEAPEAIAAYRDPDTGEFVVEALDDQYIAFVAITNKSGAKAYASGVPEQTKPNEAVECRLDPGDQVLPTDVVLLVADYAANYSAYLIETGSEGAEELRGTMMGFTSVTGAGGSGPRWVVLDPDTLYYESAKNYAGISTYAESPVDVRAAEYVDGHIFMAATDGFFYATDVFELETPERVGAYVDTFAVDVNMDGATDDADAQAVLDYVSGKVDGSGLDLTIADVDEDGSVTSYDAQLILFCVNAPAVKDIYDMAFNYADNQLYVLTTGNQIYKLDLVTGKMTPIVHVTTLYQEDLYGLAIDDEGNFYTMSDYSPSTSKLYRFTPADAVSGEIDDLEPVGGASGMWFWGEGGALAWDHGTDTLYAASNFDAVPDVDHCLFTVDTETGIAEKVNDVNGKYSACFYVCLNGLVILPGQNHIITPATEATGLEIEPAELNLLRGQQSSLLATVYPWSLEDKSVTFESDNENVVTVDADGTVFGAGLGTANITVTTGAAPYLSKTVPVTVEDAPVAQLRGIIWDAEGKGWAAVFDSDATNRWTGVAEVGGQSWGALIDDVLYTSDEDTLYAIDADTYEMTELGEITTSWIPSDAAELPADMADAWGVGRVIGICNDGTYLEIIDPEKGSLVYFDLSSYFSMDPLTVIAGTGIRGPFEDEDGETYEDCAFYYSMTESGELLVFILNLDGELFLMDLGSTIYNLEGVSNVTNSVYASMIYDEANDFLYLAHYDGVDEVAKLYAIDPDDPARSAELGDFNKDVWPVVGLYEYEPATDLVLTVAPSELELFETQAAQLKIKVKLGETNGFTAVSSDPEVATVDDTGLVTGVSAGKAVITVTTVDKNSLGEQLVIDVPVTVLAIVHPEISVVAQISDDEGDHFAVLDLSDLSYMPALAAPGALSAGGRGGSLYLGAVGTEPVVLSMEDFTETELDILDTEYFGEFPPQDIASYPNYYIAEEDYLDESSFLFTTDLGWLVTPDYYGWDLSSAISDMAAIAYFGENEEDGAVSYDYCILGADGTLYYLPIDLDEGSISLYGLMDTGIVLQDQQDASMVAYADEENYGLVVAVNSSKTVWFIDLITGKVGLCGVMSEDVANIDGLIGPFDGQAVSEYRPVPDAETEPVSELLSSGTVSAARISTVGDGYARADVSAELMNDSFRRQALGSTANIVRGGLNAVRGTQVAPQSAADAGTEKDDVLVVEISETEATRNGYITIAYDKTKLTLLDPVETDLKYYSCHDNDGVIGFAYASLETMEAGTPLATLRFSYKIDAVEDFESSVTITTVERGSDLDVDEEPVVVTLGNYVPVWTWADDFGSATVTFTVGGETTTVDAVVMIDEISSYAATCLEDGQTTYVATAEFLGKTFTARRTVVIPATGHDWKAPSWTWAYNGKSATAKFVCANDASHVETLNATVTSRVTLAPTVDEWGETTYTAQVVFKGVTYTDTLILTDISPLPAPSDPGTVTPDPTPVLYDDVKDASEWFFDAVYWADKKDCMDPKSATVFGVADHCSRAETVISLWKTLGSPEPTTTENPFVDVKADAEYYKAILWAAETRVTLGVDETHFDPDGTVTRGQAVTFLYRAAKASVPAGAVNPFEDVLETDYYYEPVLWAVANGITNGYDATHFAPTDLLTRGHIVTFLYRQYGK